MANRPLAAPQTVAQGAVILTLATLATRILGVAYRPITGLLFAPYDGSAGEAGNGLAAVPYQIYWVVLSFTAVGLNVGISRLVAERLSRGDRPGARQVFRIALGLMAALGLAGAVLLWAGAPLLAALLKAPDATLGFRATAPALLLLTLAAAYRGLFQGFRRMTEGGLSQVLEQAGRVGAGILLVWWLAPRSVALGAAGFNLGDVAGALLSLGYLLWAARRSGVGLMEAEPADTAAPAPDRSAVVRAVLRVSLPFAIIGSIQPLMGLIDTFVIFPLLAARGGIADVAFGQLTLAGSIAALPAVFSLALYTTLIPSVAAAADAGDGARVTRLARQALRATGLIALPAQAGLLVLAGPIYGLLYPGGQGGQVLAALSWSVAATMFGQTASGLLQGLGLIRLSVRHQLIGLVLKLPLTWLLVLQFGARGAAYATTAAVLAAALLNGRELARRLPGIWPWQAALLKPLLAAAAMGGFLWFLRDWAGQSRLITVPVVGLGVVLYGLALLALGGASFRDLRRVPFVGPHLGRWT